MANIMKGKVSVVGGIEFSWLQTWWASSLPDYPELGGTLSWGTPPQRWSPKKPREGAVVRRRDILFMLWDIYRENERTIPDAVWDARQALEREIMALPESAL